MADERYKIWEKTRYVEIDPETEYGRTDQLGDGDANDTTFLRGDSRWINIGAVIPVNLNDLADVNVPAPNDGDVLTYDSASGLWIAVPGGGVSDKSSVLSYQEVAGVASGVTTTIVTLAPGADTYLSQIECSGEEYGKFELYYNTVLKATKRAGPNRNVTFLFDTPYTVSNGDTFDVKVTHFVTGQTPTFECSVLGFT